MTVHSFIGVVYHSGFWIDRLLKMISMQLVLVWQF